jgi:ABC-2 type transport system ATP-binding protein
MLELHSVSKRFAGSLAVDNVTFSARRGDVTGYLGPNGSGKSTTLKIIAGVIEATSGDVRFGGISITRDLNAWKQRIGYVPEEPHLYPHLSALEYLVMVAQLRGLPTTRTTKRIEELLQLLELQTQDVRYVPLSAYSKGMRQKVLLVAALMHNPDVVLLDEPFSGLDVAAGFVLRSLIRELAARRKVVLFSSHELDSVERLASRVVILHRGKVAADDSIERLKALMATSTLEGIFSQLAVQQDSVAVSRRIADIVADR